ncbi:hypothetical protein NP493_754g00000 [Ridgeia piscesae]|uniref:Uncharacterized protein n=1 Tax=Ridgeia piscesae TaxID=27915 RepID=A0AAD9KQN3_RIDPI|nr:hypothetical protein NP493_754g00000 [Ridgeia piscesae]
MTLLSMKLSPKVTLKMFRRNKATVVDQGTTVYSEVCQSIAAEDTQRQPTYVNIHTKDTVGR